MSLFVDISLKAKMLWNWFFRHVTIIVIFLVALNLLSWIFPFMLVVYRIILLGVIFETLAMMLSGIGLFVLTRVNFTKGIIYGPDGELNEVEQGALMRLKGTIIISVHLLVGIIVLAVFQSSMLTAINSILEKAVN